MKNMDIALVYAVKARIEYVLGGNLQLPTMKNDLRNRVQLLVLEFNKVIRIYSSMGDDESDRNEWSKNILELAYGIENTIESFFVEKANASSTRRIKRFFKRSSETRFRESIKSLMSKIDPLIRLAGESGHHHIGSSSFSFKQLEEKIPAGPSVLIGIEKEVQRLLPLLLNFDDERASSVISIYGENGSGKTSLAKMVYNDPLVVKYFHCRSWNIVPTNIPATDILGIILMNLSPALTRQEILGMDMTRLTANIYKAQKDRRCLLVFDDVWDIQTINVLPQDLRRTRILITTRSEETARRLGEQIHHMKMLTPEESMKLLQTLSGVRDEDNDLIMIGEEILKECRGIPLAIDVVSRLLRRKSIHHWNEVMNELQNCAGNVLARVLELSYEHLPYHLKPCFLYLGHLRHDQVIPVEKLYSLWMAEGLIPIKDRNSIERMNVAEDYLKQLVDTNLVVAESDTESGIRRFKSCQVQGSVHNFCLSMGIKKNFIQVAGPKEIDALMSRVAIYRNPKGEGSFAIKKCSPEHIRSFLFFGTNEGVDGIKLFEWTRVLDFDGVDFIQVQNFPIGMEKLLYLRYLSFRRCNGLLLQSFAAQFLYLETLDLRVNNAGMLIPDFLTMISSLKHLYFPISPGVGLKKLRLYRLSRLEILENFHSRVCDVDDLIKLVNLQILTVIKESNPENLKKIVEFVNANNNLHQLSVQVTDFYRKDSRETLSVFKDLWNCRSLHALKVRGVMKELPSDLSMSTNVAEIVFDELEFEKDPMPALGVLQNLRSLILCGDASVDTNMLCHRLSFPNLKRLELVKLRFIKNWVVEEGAMPKLSVLKIKDCKKLALLPQGLDIANLSELKIISMSQEFQDAVRERVRGLSVSGPILTFHD